MTGIDVAWIGVLVIALFCIFYIFYLETKKAYNLWRIDYATN